MDAAVDCSSAPEWRERSPISTPSDVEATCVPRPQNLHITRRVGVDGVVIAWAPLDHDCVAGFQVMEFYIFRSQALFQVQHPAFQKNVLIKTNNPGISYCILLAGPCGRTGCTACQVPSPHKSLGDGAAPRRRLHHRFSHGRSRRALLDARHRHPGPIEGLPREKRPPAPDATEMRPDLPLT